MKHSRGPWKVGYGTNSLVVKQEGSLGYLCTLSNYPKDEQMADARLIATSPDMLRTLKNIAEHVDGLSIPAKVWEELHAVIAKAEGRDE